MTSATWWNFATSTHEPLPCPFGDLTAGQAAQYLPQDAAVQGLFDCHMALGKSIPDALTATLEAVTGMGRS